jgi:protocatechuate 3,4-dioxygenase beta subunit
MTRQGHRYADWELVPGAVTDHEGRYSVPLVTPWHAMDSGMGGATGDGFVVCVVAPAFRPRIESPFELETGREEYRQDVVLAPELAVEGRVVDDQSDEPLAGRPVYLRPDGGQWNNSVWPPHYPPLPWSVVVAVTDRDGRFRVGGLSEGAYSVAATSAVHAREGVDAFLPGTAGPFELRMKLLRPVAGVVVDPDGQPVAEAKVWLIAEGEESYDHGWDSPQTDAEGRFRFEEVKAGRYRIVATPAGEDDPLAPGVSQTIEAGDVGARVALTKSESITGRILTATGDPMPKLWVSLRDTEVLYLTGHATTDAEGRFRVEGLRPGTWHIEVSELDLTFHAVATGTEVEHRMAGSLRITGSILPQQRKAITFGDAELLAEPLRPVPQEGFTRRYVATLDADGAFAFEHLPPGEYRITGELAGTFVGKRRIFTVRGDLRANAGDEGVVVRLVFKEDR